MSKPEPFRRDAITRARFFLEQARSCPFSAEDMAWREPFEAYMEAAIVFGRVAIARFKKAAEKKARSDPELKAAVKEWWDSLKGDPAIEFLKEERDFIVHERPPVVGQNLYGPGVPHPQKAEGFYFYENPSAFRRRHPTHP